MQNNLIERYLSNAMAVFQSRGLVKIPHPNMPDAMKDKSVQQTNDWVPWKAIPSIVTNEDLAELENTTGYRYPELYKSFLQYKHFYDLPGVLEICFYRHCVRDWKAKLLDEYFNGYEPDVIIKQGFIPFADFSDWGIVCFDSNRLENGDCPVVMFDHELLYEDEVVPQQLYGSFEALMQAMVDVLEAGWPDIDKI